LSEGDWFGLSEAACERRLSGDDAKENKFFLIEIAMLKTAGGNKNLDGS